MPRKNKIKAYALIVLYSVLIITEIFVLVPFHRIQVFKSQQNVPHTEIVGNGYSTIFEIMDYGTTSRDSGRTIIGKRVNMQQLLTNVILTTIVAAAIYYLLIFKSTIPDIQAEEITELIKQNEHLINKTDRLSVEISKLVASSTSCEQLVFEKLTAKRELKNLPHFDINSIAFADEETQQAELTKYTSQVIECVEYEIHEIFARNQRHSKLSSDIPDAEF